ncbi:MAG: helix-turn-helix domain-containing protein [Clostridia bacterium]|nr:helix-turn-helix domain-containing protein [Clostridia bacterium]
MSEFVERLQELMDEQGLNRKMLAKKVGINATCISHYLLEKRIPTVESIVKIADYFQRSTDFLLGREEENTKLTFKPCPSFSERLAYIKEQAGGSAQQFYGDLGISKTCYYAWLRGDRKPTLDNVIQIANKLDRRVDYILGRES